MKVLHYQRQRRPDANFSLEFIFEDVRRRLAGQCELSVRIAPSLSNGLVKRLNIIRDVRRQRADIIHVTGDINFAVLGARHTSGMLTVPDCAFIHRARGWKRRLLKTFWLDLPVRYARSITTISNASRDDIVRLTKCDPGKVAVIPVAISPEFQFRPKPFCEARPRLLQIGTGPNKNLPRLVEAIRGLKCELAIVGRLSDEQQRHLEAAGVRYENLTSLSSSDIVMQYEQADIICFASTHEGFGMPIIEGQAVGRPVLTSNTSSMPEVAGGGGLLIDPNSAIAIRTGLEQLISDRLLRDRLVEAGRANILRFDPETIARMYLDHYTGIYEHHR